MKREPILCVCMCVAAMERECVVSRERVRVLQVELEAVCLQLHQKENTIQELVEKLQHQQVPSGKCWEIFVIYINEFYRHLQPANMLLTQHTATRTVKAKYRNLNRTDAWDRYCMCVKNVTDVFGLVLPNKCRQLGSYLLASEKDRSRYLGVQ